MTFLDARTHYRRAEEGMLSELVDPHQMILITLRELYKALSTLSNAQIRKEKYPGASISKGLTAIYILQTSLDFEQGGEISSNLFRVYEFVRLQLIAAFQRGEKAQLSQATGFISELLSAWKEIPAQKAAG